MKPSVKMLAARTRSESNNNARNYRQEMGEPVHYPNSRMEGAYGAGNNAGMEMYGYGNNRAEGAYNRYEMAGPDNWEYTRTDTANGEMEARRRYRRYDNGRFAPKNDMDDYGGMAHYPFAPPPPAYDRGADMNRIGFSMEAGEFRHDYPNNASYPRGEQRPSERIMGKAEAHRPCRMDRSIADEWMKSLTNEDGTTGPHWTYDQVVQIMQQNNLSFDPCEFWAVMNMIYSDDVAVAKRHGVNKPDYYIDRAKAWLADKDAVEGKLAAYYCYIVK